MRVKLLFCDRLYYLPPELTLDLLLRRTVEALPELAGEAFRLCYDDGQDTVILTSTAGLLDAYDVSCGHLRLSLHRLEDQFERVQCKLPDESIPIGLVLARLKAVGRLFVDQEFRGLCNLISEGVLLTTVSVIADRQTASRTTVWFQTSSFPLPLAPTKLWEVCGDVIFVGLANSYAISEVEPLEFSIASVPESDFVATLKEPAASVVKWNYLKKVTEEKLVYVSNTPGGVAGGPVFSDKWQFLGLQVTTEGRFHQAVRCGEILRGLKLVPYSPSTVSIIQLLEPVPCKEDEYVLLAKNTPDPVSERAFGLPKLLPMVLSYNVVSDTFMRVSFPSRISEGTSICQLPNALFVSGGKDSKRKCWIGFLEGSVKWFECDMLKTHYAHASIYMDHLVYVIAGRHSTKAIRYAETFDYVNRAWKPLPDLRFSRSYPSVVELNKQIYVFGGGTDDSQQPDLDNVEIFSGARWKLCEFRLPLALHGVGVLAMNNDTLIVCGGIREGQRYNTKIFTLDLNSGVYRVHEQELRLGLCSSSSPLYDADSILFFSSEGVLYKYCRHSHRMFQLRQEVGCALG
mmetsp:Transcript_25005/g.43879  ORF Transcript_25005/g.43879 Transcript_25005/m.43879 type:complete len:572 (-) Transcript_25005:29-1744(-)